MNKLFACLMGCTVAFCVATASADCGKCDTKGEAKAAGGCCKGKEVAEKGGCCKDKQGAAAKAEGCSDKGATAVAGKCCASKGSLADSCQTTGMPLMGYKVGDKVVTCPDAAKELMAANKDAKVMYVVADKEYGDQMEAGKAYSTVLGSYYEKMLTVSEVAACAEQKCPVTGKTIAPAKAASYQLASYNFENKAAAEKAATAAKAAAEKINMTMLVDGKEYTCATSAKAACTDGKKIEYVVGDTKSCCDVMASVELYKARIQAAERVLASAANPQTASRG